jgi:hypothetical protein
MDWTAIGAIGEVAGAVAVFATLLYLAAQIRAANRHAELDSIRAVNEAMSRFSGRIASSKQVASVYRQGMAGPDDLDPDEFVQFEMLILGFYDALEEWNRRIHETSRTRAWRDMQATNLQNAISYMLSQPGGRRVWTDYAMMYPSLSPLAQETLLALDTALPEPIPPNAA